MASGNIYDIIKKSDGPDVSFLPVGIELSIPRLPSCSKRPTLKTTMKNKRHVKNTFTEYSP